MKPAGEGKPVAHTLRDYFAARATEADIQAYLQTGRMIPDIYEYSDGTKFIQGRKPELRTREQAKYAYADAMIKARSL